MLAAIYRGDARPSPQRRRWRRRSAQPAVRCWLALAAYWRRRSAQPAVRRWPAPAAAALAATLGPARSGVRRWRRRSVSPSPPAVAGSEARPSPQCGACGDSRRSSPSPSLARARVGGAGLYGAGRNARSGYFALPACRGGARRRSARPRPRRWRRRSALGAHCRPPWPAPAAALARRAGDVRSRPPRLQRRRRRSAQPATAALAATLHAPARCCPPWPAPAAAALAATLGAARRRPPWPAPAAAALARRRSVSPSPPAAVVRPPPATHPPPGARRTHDPGSSWLWPHPYVTGGGAGGEARCSRRYIAATLGPARSGGAGGDAWPSPRLRRWRRCVGDAEQLAVALPTPPAQRRRRRSARLTPAAPTATRRTARSPSQARARGAAWRWKQRSPCLVPCAAPCSALCVCCPLSILSSILFCLLFCPLPVLPPAALLCILFLWLLCGWLHSRHKSCSPALARPVAGGARPGCPRN